MSSDPMRDIEDKQAQYDTGITAIRVYQGARQEAESAFEAFMATAAFFSGMMHQPPPEEDNK